MINELIDRVKKGFERIKDRRMGGGNLQYKLEDVLMTAYAMFSLKDPSLAIFRQRLEERWKNQSRVYKIGLVPEDTALRQALDGVDPTLRHCPRLLGQDRQALTFRKTASTHLASFLKVRKIGAFSARH